MVSRNKGHQADTESIDPIITELIGLLVSLGGFLCDTEHLSQCASILSAGGQAASALHKHLHKRRRVIRTAMAGITDGLSRATSSLKALSSLPDIQQLPITTRVIWFDIKTAEYQAYRDCLSQLSRGIKDIAKHGDRLRGVLEELPPNTKPVARMSDDAALLIDRLGDSLKALAGLSVDDKQSTRTSISKLIAMTEMFCKKLQSALDESRRLSFEGEP